MSTHQIVRGRIAVATLVMLCWSAQDARPAQTTDVQQQDLEATIDDLGNVDVTLKFVLPAMQWRNWKQSYGQNPSLLKRDLQHQFSALVLKDFAVESDDMNRTAIVRFKGEADAEYRGNGVWEAEIEKGVRSLKVSDTHWEFTKTLSEGGGAVQQTFRVNLPADARNSVEATDEFGTPVLRYELRTRRLPTLLIAALAAAVLGVVTLGTGLLTKRTA